MKKKIFKSQNNLQPFVITLFGHETNISTKNKQTMLRKNKQNSIFLYYYQELIVKFKLKNDYVFLLVH